MMLCVYLIALLSASVHGYYWQNVQTPDDYPANTMYYQATSGTYGSCGYTDSAVGRFLKGSNRCYIPYNGEEFEVVLPYDVLIAEPYAELTLWAEIYSVDEIRDKGVLVCDNCVGGSAMYVCASPEYGPGKLIVTDANTATCHVSYGGVEHIFNDGYVTMTSQLAVEYIVTEVNYYIDSLEILGDEPTQMSEVTMVNQDDEDALVVQSFEIELLTGSSWENEYGFSVDTSMTVTAGVIKYQEGRAFEVTETETYTYLYGGGIELLEKNIIEVSIVVPGQHSCKATIVARDMDIDVPYDATATVIYPDGQQKTEFITGIYEGVSVNQADVVYETCVPL